MKMKLKGILGLIGFVIVVLGFLYCFMNPNIYIETKNASGTVEVNVYGQNLVVPIEGNVKIRHVDYWNQNAFVIMGIGLSTILLGLVLGDTDLEVFERTKRPECFGQLLYCDNYNCEHHAECEQAYKRSHKRV